MAGPALYAMPPWLRDVKLRQPRKKKAKKGSNKLVSWRSIVLVVCLCVFYTTLLDAFLRPWSKAS